MQILVVDDEKIKRITLADDLAAEALPHAEEAVDTFTRLRSPDIVKAKVTLAECEAAYSSS